MAREREIKTAEERVYTLACAYPNTRHITKLPDPSQHVQNFGTSVSDPCAVLRPCGGSPPLERYKEVNGLFHDFFGLETDGDSTPYTVLYSSK
jgi:hypothetical protein